MAVLPSTSILFDNETSSDIFMPKMFVKLVCMYFDKLLDIQTADITLNSVNEKEEKIPLKILVYRQKSQYYFQVGKTFPS